MGWPRCPGGSALTLLHSAGAGAAGQETSGMLCNGGILILPWLCDLETATFSCGAPDPLSVQPEDSFPHGAERQTI